ncbi:MAG: hypothetical protein J6Y09_04350 [Lachnospiraceae bacterium]|nr:hypothetical protein [Lachnospiraceae bacterium]
MMKKRNLLSLAFGLFIVCLLVLSNVFIAVEAKHDCSGVHCHVCEEIEVAHEAIDALGLCVAVTFTCIFLKHIFVKSIDALTGNFFIPCSLVSQKIRIDS